MSIKVMVSTQLLTSWEFMTDNSLYDSYSTSLAIYGQGSDSNIESFHKTPSNPPSKLPLVGLLIFLREIIHVVIDMMAEDVGPVDICIARLGLAVVVSRETLLRVGDVKSPINSSLEQQQPKKND